MFFSRYWRKTLISKVTRHLRKSLLCSNPAKMVLSNIFSGRCPVSFLVFHQKLLTALAPPQYSPFVIALFRFGMSQCPVCMGDPQDPLSLPCEHIYCLACLKEWLRPGQMYCPLCVQEVDDNFPLVPSEDLRLVNVLIGYRNRLECVLLLISISTAESGLL